MAGPDAHVFANKTAESDIFDVCVMIFVEACAEMIRISGCFQEA
jgi:hypothetical protein